MSMTVRTFNPYSQTYLAEISADNESFTILFRVVDETLDNHQIFDYEKQDTFRTVPDAIRMEIERIFQVGKDETRQIAQTRPDFYDQILACLIEHFIKHNKKWIRKTKKTKVMANYKSFSVSKSLPPIMQKEAGGKLINEKF